MAINYSSGVIIQSLILGSNLSSGYFDHVNEMVFFVGVVSIVAHIFIDDRISSQ